MIKTVMLKPMKGAAVEDFSQIRWPKLGSPKIDGFRCLVSDQAYTSRLNRFPNHHVHESFKNLLPPNVWLDGEIVVGKRRGEGVLTRTSSGVTSEEGTPAWRYWVFDAPRERLTFEQRLHLARTHVEALAHPQIRYVKHKMLHDMDEFIAYLDWALKMGFEGVMLDDPDALYKNGKSTLNQQGRLKVKPFETHEARITGYYEEMENTNEAKKDATGKSKRSSAKAGKVPKGRLGGLIGNDLITGVEIRVGGGFTQQQRIDLWAIRDTLAGQLFTYSKQQAGEKNKPRHTSFIAIRPEWDMS